MSDQVAGHKGESRSNKHKPYLKGAVSSLAAACRDPSKAGIWNDPARQIIARKEEERKKDQLEKVCGEPRVSLLSSLLMCIIHWLLGL